VVDELRDVTMCNAEVVERRSSGVREISLAGQRVDLIGRHDMLNAVAAALDGRRRPLRLASANLDHIYRFDGEPGLFTSDADGQWLVLLDGKPLVRVTQRRTGRRWDHLAGSDLLPELLALCEERGARVGFLGGSDHVRARLADAVAAQWPRLAVAGHWTPPREVLLDPDASHALAVEIGAAGVDFLVVGLGKPRQEHFIQRHHAATGAKVAAAFGASAEFVAGVQERAPRLLTQLGLEWAYRLYKEPRRLAKRYLAEGPVALAKVIASRSPMRR
jgi:exopolysaccharide biosynthesis WecB/TagA/CpsF family protein